MGVRKITNGGRKVIGKFPFQKTNRIIMWESQLERDFLYLVEFDPDIVACNEQPFIVSYLDENDGELHRYTPDFELLRKRGPQQIVEIKDEQRALSEEYQHLFKMVSPILNRAGYQFIVITEREIRIQPRLKNIKLLKRYSRTPIKNDHLIILNKVFSAQNPIPLGELICRASPTGPSAQAIYSLIWHGFLSIDVSKTICSDSPVHFTLNNRNMFGVRK